MRSIRFKQGVEVSTVDRETRVIAYGNHYTITGAGSDLLEELSRGPLCLEHSIASFMLCYERPADELVNFLLSESAIVETGEFEGELRPVRWGMPYHITDVTARQL